MKQKIIFNNDYFLLRKHEALKIELAINLLPDKEYWKEIGDQLYKYHTDGTSNDLEVNHKQYIFLKYLLNNLK